MNNKVKIEVYANYTNNGDTTHVYARWNGGWFVSRRDYNAALRRLNAIGNDYLKAANVGEEYCCCSDVIAED